MPALAPLEILPVGARRIDISLLPLLAPTSQQYDDRLAVPPKIDPILEYAFPHTFDVGEIALRHAGKSAGDLCAGYSIQFREPFGEGLSPLAAT